MAKEWILNQANMRWGLTKKNKVGAVSDEIRKCAPKSLEEWEEYYYKNVYSKSHLVELGRRLYIKITEVCLAEIESIEKYIGLQIKPAGYAYITQIINELEFQKGTHKKFTDKYGGQVFYIISVKDNKRKVIHNPEVIEEIRKEISRLQN